MRIIVNYTQNPSKTLLKREGTRRQLTDQRAETSTIIARIALLMVINLSRDIARTVHKLADGGHRRRSCFLHFRGPVFEAIVDNLSPVRY